MRRGWPALVIGAATATSGCAGSTPLMHPAHTLSPGRVSMGAGVAGHIGALDAAEVTTDDKTEPVLEDFAVAPGVAPWAAGRIGIEGDNEAGLTYAGRSFRLDFRHAFNIEPLWLSIGAGGSALIPRRRDSDSDLGSAYGGGFDVPVLFGWVSDAELYSVWFGPRGGFEYLQGEVLESEVFASGRDDTFIPFSGKHGFVGGLLGARVGFRSFHVALELDVAYHFADGTFGEGGGFDASLGQLTISPAGALLLTL
ncbi:MAG: hypothetical protein HOW73_50940 [Polyangiaceae bacterium]|nr:hypothetical protein [Polyangiaceae bacterium]